MGAPERGLLTEEVEVDTFFLGDLEEGLKGGRQRGKTALVGVAVESGVVARAVCACRCCPTPSAIR